MGETWCLAQVNKLPISPIVFPATNPKNPSDVFVPLRSAEKSQMASQIWECCIYSISAICLGPFHLCVADCMPLAIMCLGNDVTTLRSTSYTKDTNLDWWCGSLWCHFWHSDSAPLKGWGFIEFVLLGCQTSSTLANFKRINLDFSIKWIEWFPFASCILQKDPFPILLILSYPFLCTWNMLKQRTSAVNPCEPILRPSTSAATRWLRWDTGIYSPETSWSEWCAAVEVKSGPGGISVA